MAALRAVLAGVLASCAISATAQTCSSVTSPAPCGTPGVDSPQDCINKGCCYNPDLPAATQCFYPGGNAVPITKVHVIQACHFDAGFADSLVGIVNRWFTEHFPQAYKLGGELEALGGPWGLRFMAQSWLIYLYTHCPPNAGLSCPNATALAQFETAVAKGWITWHAWPFNSELDLVDAASLAFGVNLTHSLDAQFGLPAKGVLSQRDVPGMSRAVLPGLAAAGVRAVSVGVNGASTAPDVPRAFVWHDPASGVRMPAMWHAEGYGGITYDDAVIVPGLSSAVVFDWRGDNAGPPQSVAEVQGDWAAIAAAFPNATTIVASTFDAWVDEMLPHIDTLPVIEAEIGDTWLHGCPSDPQKVGWYRRGQAVVADCLAAGDCSLSDPVFRNFSALFLKNSEHTWGKDVKTFLHDTGNWTDAQLAAEVSANAFNFADMQASWDEQRAWGFTYPLQALQAAGHPLAAQLEAAWQAVYPAPAPAPDAPGSGWQPVAQRGAVFNAGRWSIAFDAATGGIAYLADAATGQTWANYSSAESSGKNGLSSSPPHANPGLLAWLEYQTYSNATYAAYMANYSSVQPLPDWFFLDFGKPNCTEGGAVDQVVPQQLSGLWTRQGACADLLAAERELPDGLGPAAAGGTHRRGKGGKRRHARSAHARDSKTASGPACMQFLVQATFPGAAGNSLPHAQFGAPAVAYTWVTLPMGSAAEGASGVLNVSVAMYNKTATRLPEAMFLRFNPQPVWGGGATDAVEAASAGVGAGSHAASLHRTGQRALRVTERHRRSDAASSSQRGDADAKATAAPAVPTAAQWYVHKVASWVDPYAAVIKGSQRHHGTIGGLQYTRAPPAAAAAAPAAARTAAVANATMTVSSLDAAIVNVGRPFGLPTPTTVRPDVAEGAGWLLYDNTWGTNYVMWTWRPEDRNMQWQFTLSFE